VRAIVFDFGQVVGFFDHRLTTNRLAAHTDLPADDLHRLLFGGPLERDYDVGRLSTAAFLAQVRDACRLRCSEDAIAAAWADIFWPNEDVIALLPQLKGHVRLLLASNTNELHSRQFRRQLADALRHFDAVVLSHEIGQRKPDAAFYRHCERLAGCAAEECLFIDDLPTNVAGARACGWHGIVYTDVADLRRHLVAFLPHLAGYIPGLRGPV
jgi:putative hydrolase of the HAD superfamily